MKIKEKFTKCKDWIKEHKKQILIGGLSAVAVCGGAALLSKSRKENEEVDELPEPDYGRDCTMKFVVDETQEVLGEVPCTELYAKEELEAYEEFKN